MHVKTGVLSLRPSSTAVSILSCDFSQVKLNIDMFVFVVESDTRAVNILLILLISHGPFYTKAAYVEPCRYTIRAKGTSHRHMLFLKGVHGT
jgi:hypothetical protein